MVRFLGKRGLYLRFLKRWDNGIIASEGTSIIFYTSPAFFRHTDSVTYMRING